MCPEGGGQWLSSELGTPCCVTSCFVEGDEGDVSMLLVCIRATDTDKGWEERSLVNAKPREWGDGSEVMCWPLRTEC